MTGGITVIDINTDMLDEDTIADIILCEPITRKGVEALKRLELSKDISPSYFYNHLRVVSKYDESKEYINNAVNQIINRTPLYYEYTVDYIQFEELKKRLRRFDKRFRSDSPNEYPLLLLGVAGNGKSIEVNKRIREITSGETEYECGRSYIDLEVAFTETTYGVEYNCPKDDSLWVFCIKLLDGIMTYIKNCHSLCPQIRDNFNNIIVKKNLATDKHKLLFENIGNYRDGDNENEKRLFSLLIDLANSERAEDNIQTLLKVLMWIMYCSAPNQKQYIVFDNIEQYIKLNESKIQIYNSDISKMYKSINYVVTNIVNAFNRIEKDLGWKAFKIIIVLRRTSIGLLDSTLLHSAVTIEQNMADVTGYFQIPDIWEAKKEYVWKPFLSSRFDNSENRNIIELIDLVMNDGEQTVGTDYQSIIAPLMSYGIRRNARSQAHAIYGTYKILSDTSRETINQDEFNKLMKVANTANHTVRYMFRRALVEFQFKWAISNENQGRWEKIGIGHLSGEKEYNYFGKRFRVESVTYYNANCVTLAWRILAFLSQFPDRNNKNINNHHKSLADMFATLSLYDLIKGVLVDPKGHKEIKKDEFLQLARVLIALGDMSNGDTRSAPYIILNIRDDNFHKNPYESVLAELLSKIWDEKYEKSLPGQKYHCGDYGVRITDAGHVFLLDWQASFSFIASLHCFTIPSLFFLKDIMSIKYVIDTVYNVATALCKKYEDEASHFCGEEISLKTGMYLPRYNNRSVTFKRRVKELHINHLILYREFIEKNYSILQITRDSMIELTDPEEGFISQFISKYQAWETGKGAPKCF